MPVVFATIQLSSTGDAVALLEADAHAGGAARPGEDVVLGVQAHAVHHEDADLVLDEAAATHDGVVRVHEVRAVAAS